MGPSALVWQSKTGRFVWKTTGSGANAVTPDLCGQHDTEAHFTEFIVSRTQTIPFLMQGPLGHVTQINHSLKVCFITFSEKLKHGDPVVYGF